MGKDIFVFISILIVLQLSFISAGIYFSGLEDKYNYGDIVNLDIKADPVIQGRLLKTVLFCQANQLIEFNSLPDDTGNVNVKLPLNVYNINKEGKCYFQGSYSGEVKNTNEFEISRKLDVTLNSYSFFAKPGEEIIISGSAKKLNGDLINGEAEIKIPLLKYLEEKNIIDKDNTNNSNNTQENGNNTNSSEQTEIELSSLNGIGIYSGKVENGEFSVPININENTPAGDYRLDISVSEIIDGEKYNEGFVFGNLKVFQVLKSIDIALNKVALDPGENFEFKPLLLDQTNNYIDEEVSVIISSLELNRVYEKIGKAQQTVNFPIPTNLSSGYYVIEARSGDINTTKKFYVNEKAIVSFLIENQTLTVTNIGNIPYKRDIEVLLNDKTFLKKVNLELGESQKFKLSGSDGEYIVKVSDGESILTQDGVRLTGYSINVNAVGEGNIIKSVSPVVWIFLIVILTIGILFLLRNIFKKRSYAYDAQNIKKSIPKQEPVKKNLNDVVVIKPGIPKQAEQSIISKGEKDKATVLALKIKSKLNEQGKQILQKVIETVYEKKAAVYEQSNSVYIIFSKMMTHSEKNDIEAIKIAYTLLSTLNDYNKKFKEKIEFGIGINSGEIIGNVELKKLRFTSLGNFMILAKRLAELSDKKILISKEIYEKGKTELKVNKITIDDNEVYELISVVDHDKNKKFIEDFLKRSDNKTTTKNPMRSFVNDANKSASSFTNKNTTEQNNQGKSFQTEKN